MDFYGSQRGRGGMYRIFIGNRLGRLELRNGCMARVDVQRLEVRRMVAERLWFGLIRQGKSIWTWSRWSRAGVCLWNWDSIADGSMAWNAWITKRLVCNCGFNSRMASSAAIDVDTK